MGKTTKKTHEQYLQELKDKDIKVILLEQYVNNSTSIKHKCLQCNTIFTKTPSKILDNNRKGLSNCNVCSDGVSIPNKFVSNIIKSIDIKFETEKSFDWSNLKRYDIYIENNCCIIENHGIQHYEECFFNKLSKKSLQDEKENDRLKEQLAKENGIEHYIILDCRKSELEWIKKSVMESELPTLFNFKEDDIDWTECYKNSLKSLVIQACELWNGGNNNVSDIGNILKVDRVSIITYLKRGASVNICCYNPKQEIIKSYSKMKEARFVQIKCLNTGEIFNNIQEASNKYQIKLDSISACCSGYRQSAGKINGDKAIWSYVDKTILDEIKTKILKYKNVSELNKGSNADEKCAYVLKLWEQFYDVSVIHEKSELSINTITRYLNRCAILGLCKYDGIYECNKNKQRKVICITTNKIFNSIKDAEAFYDLNKKIWKALSGKVEYCGILNGEKLIWEYFDESTLLNRQGA